MGIYLETGTARGKATWLLENGGAQSISSLPYPHDIPSDMAFILVVDNGFFEAAAWIYDTREFTAFLDPSDLRPKTLLLVPVDMAMKLANINYDPRKF